MLKRAASLAAFFLMSVFATGQEQASWNHYGGSQRGTQYSTLQQITPKNVSALVEAWRHDPNRFRTSGHAGQKLMQHHR